MSFRLEPRADGSLALRLGFRQVEGFRAEWAKQIADARNTPFASVEELARRANLPPRSRDTSDCATHAPAASTAGGTRPSVTPR